MKHVVESRKSVAEAAADLLATLSGSLALRKVAEEVGAAAIRMIDEAK